MELFTFLGILMGVAIRTRKPLDLHLAPMVWKQLTNTSLVPEDIEEVLFSIIQLNYVIVKSFLVALFNQTPALTTFRMRKNSNLPEQKE